MNRNRIVHCAVIATTSSLIAASAAIAVPAFPGAEGFGANAVGGRGGDVYHVTTLDPDVNHVIPGSLTYGLYNKNVPAAGRTIVFDVGGTIYCNTGTITFKDIHNVTIAGQTAPGPGITIIGDTFGITGNSSTAPTHDIIVRYLTVRKGAGNGDDGMHVQGTGNTHDIILDHISGSWSEDEVISATQTATNVTVQNSIMSEALTASHAYGSLIRPTVNSKISYTHNLYSNQKSRNPRPGTYDGSTLDFEFQNNVIYNWSDRAGYTAGADGDVQHINMNYVGNYLIAGPVTVDNSSNSTRRSTAFYKEVNTDPLDLHFFQQDNKIDTTAGPTRDGVDTGWGMFKTLNGSTITPFPVSDQSATRFDYPANTADSADIAYAKVIASVGAFPWNRSAIDNRLINDVLNYTGTAPLTAPDPNEWNSLVNAPMVTRPAGFDTDADGMPNSWEITRGTNPSAADNNGTIAGNGYTNLENYINSLTFIANWNLDANGSWSGIFNWRGTLPNSNYATANFNPGITQARTVTLDVPVTVSDMNFDSAFGYTLNGAGPLTVDALSGYATINTITGSHTIAAPVTLADNVLITTNPGSSLAFTGELSATGKTITKSGAGAAQFENVRAAGLNVMQGLARIREKSVANDPSGTSVVGSLSIANGASLDLSNNSMVVDYTGAVGTLVNTVRQHFQTGRISSSSADAAHQLGYADNAALGLATFGGQSVDSTSILIKYTFGGDANLDGTVDVSDLGALATSWQSSGVWVNGDFNYDGFVDVSDLGMLATNWQQSSGSLTAAMASVGLGGASVPEPGSVAAALVVGLGMLGRRSRLMR